jgi:hypothetical protein
LNYEKTTNPHALTTINPKSNAVSSDELAVTYTDFRKIRKLTEGTGSTAKEYTITYGVDEQRRMSEFTVNNNTTSHYYFGDYDRVTGLTEVTNGTKTLAKGLHYDSYGRVDKETFPSGYYVENHYDAYGNLYKITDSNTPTARVIWEATEANARGQLTKLLKGTKETVYGYDEAKGQLTSMAAAGVVNYGYSYDAKNNLEYRSDNLIGQKEKFTYDTKNRLTNWDILNSNLSLIHISEPTRPY